MNGGHHKNAINGHSNSNHLQGMQDDDDVLMCLWYVSKPFEVVRVFDTPGLDEEELDASDRPRPLVAVDFEHAVWIEYNEGTFGDDSSSSSSSSQIRIRIRRMKWRWTWWSNQEEKME